MSDRLPAKGKIVAPIQQLQGVIAEAPSEAILDWFNLFHLWDFITAEVTEGKPNWTTSSKFPLSPKALYQRWRSSSELVGVRFKSGKKGTTSYALLDIDAGSQYHPQQAASAIQTLTEALEEIGICRHIKLRSSASHGLHIYLPLPRRFNCYKLAVVLRQTLEKHKFQVKPGQLEIFPNVKMPRSNYAAHRLPLQLGSFILDDAFHPLHNSIEQLIQVWSTLAESQDPVRLAEAIASVKWNRSSQPRNLGEWQERLEASLSQGFRKGQTNNLVKEVCIYLRVFRGMPWDEVETQAHAVITGLPGYQNFCGHKREIKRRIRDWVKTNRESDRYYPANSLPRSSKAPKAPSNEARSQDALHRIQQAIAYLVELGTLPDGVRDRQDRIRGIAQCGTKTLWKYKELWHPNFQNQGCVTKDISATPAFSEQNTCLLLDAERILAKQSGCVTKAIPRVSANLEEASATGAIAESHSEQAITPSALLSVISGCGSKNTLLSNNTARSNLYEVSHQNSKFPIHSIVKRTLDNELFRITQFNLDGTYWAKWFNPPVPRVAVILRENEIEFVNHLQIAQ